MKIGLIDVDGHSFPNLALMKISAFHKTMGDSVEWVNYLDSYDKVYASKVFTFTPDIRTCIQSDEIVRGGTGYGNYETLFCDDMEPDYYLYPISKWYNNKTAYGFLTRGCIRKCPWCIVPKKEGIVKPYRDIETVLQNRSTAILMDNNVLASDYGLSQIEKIVDLKCKVDFNQGMDSRLVTGEVAKLLSKVKWLRYIRFACDSPEAVDPLISAIEKLNKYGVKNYKIFVYLLVGDVCEANRRSEIMKNLGVIPFAQPYRDFCNNIEPTDEQKKFARYVNRKEIYKTISWKDYKTSIRNNKS